MDELYPSLTRASLDQNYLHANSTTHEFLFGALAELVDNARDADATKINVFTTKNEDVRGGFTLNFLDDGEGMDSNDVANIVQFGRSSKRLSSDNMIGQYGNGLKSGSMRIGNDFMLFSKRGRSCTCLMLSRTFLNRERISNIIVPMPVWDADSRKPIYDTGGKAKYDMEIELIKKYSPFKTEREVIKQFDSIKDRTGTLIVLYNVKLLDSGNPELDVLTDPTDIRMAEIDEEDKSNWPERVSFKAYVSILYLDPRMKVYIQGKKVRTKRLANCLYKPKSYKYSSTRFKKRSEDEVRKAENEFKLAEERWREAESDSKDKEKKVSIKANPKKAELAELRNKQEKSRLLKNEVNQLRDDWTKKKASLKEPKTLDFIFGFNITNRKYYGMFIYNCNRLIRMYERVGPQIDGGVNCSGVIGVVNVPYLVLEPTHNKQNFADNKEYMHMLKAMGDHLQCYWRESKVSEGKGVMSFWENFGYLSSSWSDEPSNDPRYLRARAMHIPKVIQCDGCRKWRVLPFQSSAIGKEPPENWICSMNPDLKRNKCQCAEEKPSIPVGEFKKETKSIEQKRAEKEEKLLKMQKEINKISKLQTVSSSRDAQRKLSDVSFSPPRRQSSRSSRRSQESSESEEEEEEEYRAPSRRRIKNEEYDDDDEPPPPPSRRGDSAIKRKLPPPAPTSNYKTPPRKLSAVISTPNHVSSSTSRQSKEYMPARKKAAIEQDEESEDEDLEDEDDDAPIQTVIGQMVEVDISGKWRAGRIVSAKITKSEPTKWRIKFDQHPQDRFDKWLEEGSDHLRFVNDVKLANGMTLHNDNQEASGTASNEQLPHSSTDSGNIPAGGQLVTEQHENALGKLRTCLRYFLPPQWKMPKEEINNLSLQELVDFPMDDFFDHYEKGLRKLVSNFRTQADQQRSIAANAKKELETARKLLLNVLKKVDSNTPELEGEALMSHAQQFVDDHT
ncbi:ATPase MORC2A-like [Styela clava]